MTIQQKKEKDTRGKKMSETQEIENLCKTILAFLYDNYSTRVHSLSSLLVPLSQFWAFCMYLFSFKKDVLRFCLSIGLS